MPTLPLLPRHLEVPVRKTRPPCPPLCSVSATFLDSGSSPHVVVTALRVPSTGACVLASPLPYLSAFLLAGRGVPAPGLEPTLPGSTGAFCGGERLDSTARAGVRAAGGRGFSGTELGACHTDLGVHVSFCASATYGHPSSVHPPRVSTCLFYPPICHHPSVCPSLCEARAQAGFRPLAQAHSPLARVYLLS